VGRFISEDPVGWRAGPNFYRYADGSPVRHIDPLGWIATTARGADICPAASFGGNAAATCCRNNRWVPCFNERQFWLLSSKARDCLYEHELSHIQTKTTCRCSSPRCVPQGDPNVDPHKTECLAYMVSYLCFKDSGEWNSYAGMSWEGREFGFAIRHCFFDPNDGRPFR